MHPSFKIREFKPEDHEELLDLIRLNIPVYFHESEIEDFVDYLKNEREDYFVVNGHSGLIGCGGINYDSHSKSAFISWDMIHPDFHGQGVGTALLKKRLALINKQPEIKNVVVRTSQHAWKFYQRAGFELLRIEKDYWAEGIHMYYMTLTQLS